MTILSTIARSVLVVSLGLGAGAQAAEPPPATPLQLRRVMQELGQHMQASADAIAREDWKLLATLAPKIGEHAQPPAGEKLRILTFLAGDAARFRGLDQQVHAQAQELGAAAAQRDGQAVIAAFAKVQTACLACHQGFRDRFQAHFHAAKPLEAVPAK